MTHSGAKDGLLDRILSAKRRVVLLRGPVRTGKTAAALHLYRYFQDTAPGGRCMLIAPNRPAVAQLQRQLLRDSPGGVVVQPQVTTFAALAERILTAAGKPSRQLSAMQRHLLLRGIVDELSEAGKLSALGAVADTAGIVTSLDASIAELKRAAVEPEALAEAVGRAGGKLRDLLNVYRRFQQRLRERDAYDVEGRMWLARDVMAEMPPDSATGPDGLAAMVVDGFTDFTPTQLAILRLLAPRLERLVITLCHKQDGRDRLWHWTQRTLNRIQATFGDDLVEIELEDTPDDSLPASLAEALFVQEPTPRAVPSRLEIIAAAGEEAELAVVARRVKRLLLAGAPAGSIAVLTRSMQQYRPAIERVFGAHGIGVAGRARPLPEIPIVRFLLGLPAIRAGDFAFSDVLRFIKNSYFRPQALGPYDGATVATAEMMIRQANVLNGRAAYARAAVRLAGLEVAEDDNDDQTLSLGPLGTSPRALKQAAEMLESLFDLAETATEPAGLLAAIDSLDLHAAACQADQATTARDLRALAALEPALRELAEWKLPSHRLAQALSAVTCPPGRNEAMVDLLDVIDARCLRYDHAFLIGVNEGQFPRHFVDGSLIRETDRSAWAQRGLPLDSRSDLTSREMMLFYLAATRAEQSLTLSFQASDATGSPRAPGSFLLSALEPFGGLDDPQVLAATERIPPGQIFADAQGPACPRDAAIVGIAGLFGNADSGDALHWTVTTRPQFVHNAAAGIFARRRRWLRGPCDCFDGRITDADLLAKLGARFPAETVFSPSQFNTFGQCPWQYFARYVLKLAPLDQPARRLEAQPRGLFCHSVLQGVMTQLQDKLNGPVRLLDVDESHLLEVLDEQTAIAARQVEDRHPPYPALWEIQKVQMHRQLREYLLRQRANQDLAPAHLHFELGFAPRSDRTTPLDPASHAEPLIVETSAGPVQIRGVIDRVDRVRFEDAEALLVVDYKTGRLPSAKDIQTGRNLQLPIYAAATMQMLGQRCLGGAFHRIAETDAAKDSYFAAMKLHGGKLIPNARFPDQYEAAMENIGQFVAAMSEGRFDVQPTHECPSYCPLRQICHYSPARADLKSPAAEGPS